MQTYKWRRKTGGEYDRRHPECLNILSKSKSKLIICPARDLETMRVPAAYRNLLETGRVLIVSAFSKKQRQSSAGMANRRNHLVAALAHQVFVAYAAPGSKTEQLCRQVVDWNKPLFTFSSDANQKPLRAWGRRYR